MKKIITTLSAFISKTVRSTQTTGAEHREGSMVARPFVKGYKAVETAFVKGYAAIERGCVNTLFKKKDETVEQSIVRLKSGERKAHRISDNARRRSSEISKHTIRH